VRLRQSPEGVTEQRDRDDREHHRAEGLTRDRPKGALLVGGGAADAERQLKRQHADDQIDHAARRETRASEPFKRLAARRPRARGARRGGCDLAGHAASLPALRAGESRCPPAGRVAACPTG